MGVEAAILGGSIGSALIGSSSARRASRAQTGANAAAIAEQRRQFDEIMRLTGPQRAVGNQAMNAIAQLLGLPGFTPEPTSSANAAQPLFSGGGLIGGGVRSIVDAVNRQSIDVDGTEVIPADQSGLGDFDAASALANIPGNDVIVNDVMRRIRQSSPTTGGNVLTALADRVGGFQSDRLFSSLFQLAGFGPSGTGAAVAGAGNTGNAVSRLLQSSGLANASGIIGQGQAVNSGLQNILQFFALQNMLGGSNAALDASLTALLNDPGIF